MQYQEFYAVHADTGKVLPNATVVIRASGSDAFASIFDANGVAIQNPTRADSVGHVGFMVADGEYDIQFQLGPYTAPPITKILFFDPVQLIDSATGLVAQVSGQVEAVQAIANQEGAFRASTLAAAISAGVGATNEGDTFSATGDDVDYIGVYRHDAGPLSTEIYRGPKAEAVKAAANLALQVNRATAAKFDNPNWFTGKQVTGEDLTVWTYPPQSTVSRVVHRGEHCIRVAGGSAWVSIPRAHFEESKMVSVGMLVKKWSGLTSNSNNSSFRCWQKDSSGTVIAGTEYIWQFPSADFDGDTSLPIEGKPLHVNCVSVEYRPQASANAGTGEILFAAPVACGGPSALYRDSPATIPPEVLKRQDLNLEITPNLAKPAYLLKDIYVTDTGSLNSIPGWRCYRIPVVAGQKYTFGNFSIVGLGYYAFRTDSTVEQNGSFNTSGLPVTVTAPAGAIWVYIDVARPSNSDLDWVKTIICLGDTLIPYVPGEDTVKGIGGYPVAGDIDTTGLARLGDDANFDKLTSSSFITGTLILNLPSGSTRPPEVDPNEAWLDTSGAGDPFIRVRVP